MKPPRPFFAVLHYGGYPLSVLLAHAATPAQIARKLTSIGCPTEPEEIEPLGGVAGSTTLLSGGNTVIQLATLDSSPVSVAVMVHEAFHAVVAMLDTVGIQLAQESEEAYAYALQDLTQQILMALPKRK